MNELRTRDAASGSERVDKLNKTIDSKMAETEESLSELEEYLNSCIEILQERVMESTDVGHVLALARLLDQKLEISKRRTDLIKMRISDKTAELAAQKKPAGQSSLEDILSGVQSAAAMGAAAGGAIGATKAVKSLPPPQPDIIIVDSDNHAVEIDEVDADTTESIVDKLVTVQRPRK